MRRVVSVAVVFMIGLVATASAAAAALIEIPLEQVIRGREGEVVLVADAPVPPDLVGQECEMLGETLNQSSVHPGNDLLVQVGDQVRTIVNFEDERDIRYEFRTIESMPARIQVSVRLGPDGVSSGGFLITIDCDLTPPTTTTEAPTTTTEAPTTTIEPPSSSEPAPSTTEAPATTTEAPPVTVAPPAQEQPPQLAVTGLDAGVVAALGVVLVLLGAWLLRVVGPTVQRS